MPHKVYPHAVHESQAHPVNKMASHLHVEVVGAGGKPLPAPYQRVFSSLATPADICRSSGDEALDTLAFLHILEQLKVRTLLESEIDKGRLV